jgi:hypothetical protein
MENLEGKEKAKEKKRKRKRKGEIHHNTSLTNYTTRWLHGYHPTLMHRQEPILTQQL